MAVHLVIHADEVVQPFLVPVEQLQGEAQRVALDHLLDVVDMRLDHERRLVGALSVVHADVDQVEQLVDRPDGLEFDPPEGCACMLTDDGTPTTLCLAQGLQERGWSVVVLSYPASLVLPPTSWPTDIPRVMLTDLSEAVLTTHLDAIADQYGPIGTLIYLQPVSQDDRPMVAKQFLQHALLLAKHLKPSLHEAATLGRSSFFTVTRLDGQLGMGPK